MKLIFFLLILFFYQISFGQTSISTNIENKVDCKMVKDTVDFGTGKTTYNKETVCLDSIFTIDYFENINIKYIELSIDKNAKKIRWGDSAILLGQNELFFNVGKTSKRLGQNHNYTFESAFEIFINKKTFLVVFLFPHGMSSHLINYPIILIDQNFNIVRFIDDENVFSPNPARFCDIDNNGELDYMSIDYFNGKVNFFNVLNWTENSKYSLKVIEDDEKVLIIKNDSFH